MRTFVSAFFFYFSSIFYVNKSFLKSENFVVSRTMFFNFISILFLEIGEAQQTRLRNEANGIISKALAIERRGRRSCLMWSHVVMRLNLYARICEHS